MSGMGSGPPQDSIAAGAWSVLKLPLQILCLGGVVLLLIWGAGQFSLPAGLGLSSALPADNAKLLVGVLVFLIGISFAVFLWWLASRYFRLLTGGSLTPESAAALKDLPLALPEGTVRAVLALVVGVVGLPILLFTRALDLDPAIAGYVNGIIIGVFGFYFGSRTSGVPTQAVNQIAAAQNRATQAEAKVGSVLADTAKQVAEAGLTAVAGAERAGKLPGMLDQLSRHAAVADAVLDVIAPALPKGLLPASVTDALSTAKTVLDTVSGIPPGKADESQVQQVADATGALLGGGSSPLGALVALAGPLLGGAGPLGLLLTVGAKLSGIEFNRWRSRVLAAPVSTEVIPAGTLTPSEVQEAFETNNPPSLFKAAFGAEADVPGFYNDLALVVLQDDAAAQLWQKYGQGSPKPLFATEAALRQGLDQLRQTLLARRSRQDLTPPLLASVSDALGGAPVTQDQADAVLGRAAAASVSGDGKDPQAALDALVTLVGVARARQIDLPTALAEVKP